MRFAALSLSVVLLGCASHPPAQQAVAAKPGAATCSGPRWKVVVAPFNTGEVKLDVSGAEKQLAATLVKQDPCFLVLDREWALAHEKDADRCAPDNPHRDQFDCGPGKSGLLLGAEYTILTTVIAYDPSLPRTNLLVRLVAVDSGKTIGSNEIGGRAPQLFEQVADQLSEWREHPQ